MTGKGEHTILRVRSAGGLMFTSSGRVSLNLRKGQWQNLIIILSNPEDWGIKKKEKKKKKKKKKKKRFEKWI